MTTGTSGQAEFKSREEVARFVEFQFSATLDETGYVCRFNKGSCFHYGRQDVRELLDFIYGGPPENEDQNVRHWSKIVNETQRIQAKSD